MVGFVKNVSFQKIKSKTKTIEDLLWKECRRICLNRDQDRWGRVNCYTCDAEDIQGANRQLGHVPYPKAVLGANLKYDLRVLHWQCYRCNIHFGGMGGEAYKRMTAEFGKRFMNRLEKDKQKTVKASDYYPKLLENYKKL